MCILKFELYTWNEWILCSTDCSEALKKTKTISSIWTEGMGDIFGLYKGKWVTANGAIWFYNALSQDA